MNEPPSSKRNSFFHVTMKPEDVDLLIEGLNGPKWAEHLNLLWESREGLAIPEKLWAVLLKRAPNDGKTHDILVISESAHESLLWEVMETCELTAAATNMFLTHLSNFDLTELDRARLVLLKTEQRGAEYWLLLARCMRTMDVTAFLPLLQLSDDHAVAHKIQFLYNLAVLTPDIHHEVDFFVVFEFLNSLVTERNDDDCIPPQQYITVDNKEVAVNESSSLTQVENSFGTFCEEWPLLMRIQFDKPYVVDDRVSMYQLERLLLYISFFNRPELLKKGAYHIVKNLILSVKLHVPAHDLKLLFESLHKVN